jgi:hypothetical protein
MIVWERMYVRREVVLIPLVVNKYSHTCGWVSPNSCALSRVFIHRSRSVAAVMACTWAGGTYFDWATCVRKCRGCYTACLMETLLQSSEHFVVCVTSYTIMYCEFNCLRTTSTIRDTKGEEHAAIFVVCAFLDHLITTEP